MRVKVLYTFDDQNKSNCLARLPNVLSIPTVSLDETTQVGVIELKTCIQAIVAASPELVAKLGHDFTVYAYDYSEYETPLVGQGMLSWILASASTTPNAPAHQSQTMVTGRVCKNILGLFSNGVKETLEVKLKLVPVPTCLQREYVENLERYHSLSKVMPEGLNYSAWADFLKANPAIGQLAQPTSEDTLQRNLPSFTGGVESIHQMLTRPSSQEEDLRTDRYYEQQGIPHSAHETRASSPAMSTASYNPFQVGQDSRPASRASVRSDTAAHTRRYSSVSHTTQDRSEGPPKKRACVTKAQRPKKAPLATKNDSLRVAASTAASVRLHRPVPINPAAVMATVEQIPRAPTPRPEEAGLPQSRGPARLQARPPAPSTLRQASMDEGSTYISPYMEPSVFLDNAVDSADDERGGSPVETPIEIPSSPPVMRQRIASSAPSSPGLPTLPCPTDSGFVSDLSAGRDEDEVDGSGTWEGSDLPATAEVRLRGRQDRSHHPWTEVTPGPMDLLPKAYIPKPKTYPRPRPAPPATKSDIPVDDARFNRPREQSVSSSKASEEKISTSYQGRMYPVAGWSMTSANLNPQQQPIVGKLLDPSGFSLPMENPCMSQTPQTQPRDIARQPSTDAGSPNMTDASFPVPLSVKTYSAEASSRSTTPNPFPPKQTKPSKPRGLPRSQTWSGEPMSDAAVPFEGNHRQPRSGSGAKRKQTIINKLNARLEAGETPDFCGNCGEIETPTWRKCFARLETGDPTNVEISTDGIGIVGLDAIVRREGEDGPQQYRIFKQILDLEEKDSETFEKIVLCNPCGLWLSKKGCMRPPEVWIKNQSKPAGEKPKRKRNPPKGPRKRAKANDDFTSDAPVLHSEPVMPEAHGSTSYLTNRAADIQAQQPLRCRALSFQANDTTTGSQLDQVAATAALRRAIQSSPVAMRGCKDTPIDVESDLTPRPTRRLLFPSPRKAGEVKSLDNSGPDVSPTSKAASDAAKPTIQAPGTNTDDNDKENCPPPTNLDDDDLAHLFEEPMSPKTTPSKGTPLHDLLKTPTQGSRCRSAPTPKRGSETGSDPFGLGLTTPTRNLTTPNRIGKAATVAPLTPFTAQLNALLSDGLQSSPSHAIDFSAFPSFNTPGRLTAGIQFCDFTADDFLSSDLPMSSSPPGGLGFSLYEDPATSTAGLWSGASIFEGSDGVVMECQQDGDQLDMRQSGGGLKNDASVDFAAMIDEVVGNGHGNAAAQGQGQDQELKWEHEHEHEQVKEAEMPTQ
ncbi:uncharacterized protein BDR25DRAFT_287738 [Lindgomyces ingoldianus]|uniref:Uncharacterized protein n=1 Tax=Lindgomyces ingoldianus TaxID=673940 RepID=A0ACB6QVG2_9PLEO|nr:uncharacterized protein BDR25DRAFT_287738 [Lindgomyces ingoldianus]KAF2470075.1 hypothetical protein BDR25DRAFT_287738 [Lindgomyces ingoldianus]